MSLWSFAHPQKSASRVVTGADEVTAVEQAALRFDRLVSIAEAAKATAAELPPPDGYNWFQPWAKLLTAARTRTQQVESCSHRSNGSKARSLTPPKTKSPRPPLAWTNGSTTVANPWSAPISETSRFRHRQPRFATSAQSQPLRRPTNGPTTSPKAATIVSTLHFQPLGPTSTQIRLIGLLLIAGLTGRHHLADASPGSRRFPLSLAARLRSSARHRLSGLGCGRAGSVS